MRILNKDITPSKLQQYALAKAYQARSRLRTVRKPASYIRHPGEYLTRRRAAHLQDRSDRILETRQALIETGFSSADALVDRTLLNGLQELGNERLRTQKKTAANAISASKTYWHDLTTETDFRSDSAMLRYALQPEIIAVVTALFGQVPHLTILELANTQSGDGDDWRGSQRWHRDYGDSRTIKLFTYLTDVMGPDDGPFAYIPKDAPGHQRLPRFPVHKVDAMLDQTGLLSRKVDVCGPRGTAFLIDTHNCFHCGSRIAPGSERLAFIATYNTFASYINYRNGVRAAGPLSKIDQLVLRL